MPGSSPLFATKPLTQLLEELHGEQRLRRVLGPVQLSALGIGAVIGAGIFVATGEAAHNVAGPALMLSYVVGRWQQFAKSGFKRPPSELWEKQWPMLV